MKKSPAELSSLSPDARKLAHLLLRKKGVPEWRLPILPRPASQARLTPASFAQRRLWFLDQIESEVPLYNLPYSLRMKGRLDRAALLGAVDEILRRHEVLRTSFALREGQPVQLISPFQPVPTPMVDLSRLQEVRREEEISRLAAEEAIRRFDLSRDLLMRATLLKLDHADHALFLTVHHIASDAWSGGILFGELEALYKALCEGSHSPLPPLEIQYADFALWQIERHDGPILNAQREYWRERLGQVPEALELPTDRARPSVPSYRGGRRRFRLPAPLTEELSAVGRSSGATLFMTLLAAFETLLHRYSGQGDLLVASPIANRNRSEVEGLIGYFVNTLVLRNDLSGDPTFSQLLAQVRETTLEAYDNQDLPFEKLVEELQPERNLGRQPLAQVMFQLQNAAEAPPRLQGLELGPVDSGYVISTFDLALSLWKEEGGGLEGELAYRLDLFREATARRLLGHYRVLLEGIAQEAGGRLGSYGLLTESERRLILHEWDRTDRRQGPERCLHQGFLQWARRSPRAEAWRFQGRSLSYGELAQLARDTAHLLRAQGLEPGRPAALLLDSGPLQAQALLGVLLAGGCFACLDPSHPSPRLLDILQQLRPALLLCDRSPARAHASLIEQGSRQWGLRPLRLDRPQPPQPQAPALPPLLPSQRAYVAFTSGSTGRPKGIVHTHASLGSFLAWYGPHFGIGPGCRVGNWTSITFDPSYCQIFAALSSGAALCQAPDAVRSDPEAALRWLLDEGLTHLELVPSFARHLADSLQRSAPQSRHSLRSLAFVGEPLQAPLLERFAQLLGPGCRLSNLYGPTEAVAVACRSGGPPWNGPGSVPVGPAVDGCQLWTAQPDGSPCPIGVKGEVVIRSRSLASGYWSPPSGPSPFAPDPWGRSRPARIYRSGDLGRLLPDGSLQLLGRLDHQVKVRGVRVELGEVESALAAHPAVAECAAAALPSPQGGLRLAAYLAPAQQQDRSLPGEYVRQCRQLYDGIYALRPQFSSADPGINLRAWTSAYTNRPLPEKTILDCVEDSARRIRSHAPRRVLEMGAGSGLLAFRLAPDCSSYRAADLSPQALDYLRSRLRRTPLPSLRLEQRQADDFSGIEEASLDAVVLNLVAMHFPDAPYLMRFLDSALLALRPGGLLFVGGLRHLALLPALQASVILQRAPGEASAASLRAELHERLRWEKDLLIDPRLFALYARTCPLAQGLRLLPKGTPGSDEISRYQYDALIYRRAEDQPPPAPRLSWREAPRGERGLQRLQAELLRRRPSCLALRSLPNARLQQDLAARSLIDSSLHSAGRLRSLCRQASAERAFDPARLTRWAEGLGYHAEASWARGAADGSFDLILCRRQDFPQPPLFDLCSQQDPQPWERYLNNPLRQAQASQLVPQLRRHLKALLPEPYVPSAFVILDQLPRSPNGKIDRKALPAPEPTRAAWDESFAAPATPTEFRLAKIWEDLLGHDLVGRRDDFFDLGGHSLLATQVINRVRRDFETELPLRRFLESPTLAGLAAALEDCRQEAAAPEPLRPMLERDNPPLQAPLSFAQQRLWFLDQLQPGNPLYNISIGVEIEGELDVDALAEALNEIVRRHEILRTTVHSNPDDEPFQRIHPFEPQTVPVIDLSRLPESLSQATLRSQALQEARRPFRLDRDPLLRSILLRQGNQRYALLLTFHHIASDGWSAGVLFDELTTLYEAYCESQPPPLKELPIQYADFALWQRGMLAGHHLEVQLRYWKEKLSGRLPVLELPTDRVRPSSPNYRSSKQGILIAPDLRRSLLDFSRSHSATPFMTLLAGLQALLHRYTHQSDILVGSPIANRNRAEVEGLIGFFVNTLVLRGDLGQDPSFEQLLIQLRETALQAYAHQDLPFERLVEELQPERDLNRQPLFQVLFQLQNAPFRPRQPQGLKMASLDIGSGAMPFDLALTLADQPSGMRGFFEYSTDLFHPSTIRRLEDHFLRLLEEALLHPAKPLSRLSFLSPDERRQLLAEWDRTQLADQSDTCLHWMFEAQVERTPHEDAISWQGETLSYRELDRRANRIARALVSLGAEPGGIVALLFQSGFDQIAALLGVLKAGCAFLCLEPESPVERTGYVLEEADPRCLLGDLESLTQIAQLVPDLSRKDCSAAVLDAGVDQLSAALGQSCRGREILQESADDALSASGSAQDTAFLVYTSGSTGKPKGIVQPQRCFGQFVSWWGKEFEIAPGKRFAQWASISYDAAYAEIFGVLCFGATLCLADAATRQDPPALLEWARRDRLTHFLSVPSFARQLLEADQESDDSKRPLERLEYLLLAGERFSGDLARTLRAQWGPSLRIYNLFGPTESVLATHYRLPQRIPAHATVPVGRALDGRHILVLDPNGELCPIGVSGEIHIRSPYLSAGYFGDSEATRLAFPPSPLGDAAPGRVYRTGDIGRWRSDGHLEFLGRRDHQVKIRGMRVELQEIEAVLSGHPKVRESAVLAPADEDGQARLIACIASDEPLTDGGLRDFLKPRLPRHMTPSGFLFLDSLPRTASGKVDRPSLAQAAASQSVEESGSALPRTPAESAIAEIWQELLSCRRIGRDDDFFELGGHSLLATRAVNRLRRAFSIDLPLRTFMATPRLSDLARVVERAAEQSGKSGQKEASLTVQPRSRPASGEDRAPTSFAQQRLWFLDQFKSSRALYNVPYALQLEGDLDLPALERALNAIIRRHEVLRTVFRTEQDRLWQLVRPYSQQILARIDLTALSDERRWTEARDLARREARRSFRLDSDPALRSTIVEVGQGQRILLLTFHHIAFDGWSVAIFFRELTALYAACVQGRPSGLDPLPVQYADYACWQRGWLHGSRVDSLLDYWKNQLEGAAGVVDLPTDFVRPAVQSFDGGKLGFQLSRSLTEALEGLGRPRQCTLFMTLLAAWKTLLYRYTGQADLLLCSPIANRKLAEVEGLIGYFINTLVLRGRLCDDLSFDALLAQVRQTTLEAYEHQDLPFEKLVEELQPERDLSRHPLSPIMFQLQNAPQAPLRLCDLQLSNFGSGEAVATFDLALSLWKEEGGGLEGELAYRLDLFREATARRLLGHYRVLLEGIGQEAGGRLGGYGLLTESERRLILHEWDRTDRRQGPERCLHQGFLQWARRSPRAEAWRFQGRSLSYGELAQRARDTALLLRAQGLEPGRPAALLLDSGPLQAQALLGVLLAGGCFACLDPSHPSPRLLDILQQLRPALLLCDRSPARAHASLIEQGSRQWGLRPLRLDRPQPPQPQAPALPPLLPSQRAYVAFTSGSTGRPKGIVHTHASLGSFLAWYGPHFGIGPGCRVGNWTSITFDPSYCQIFAALSSGAALCQAPEAVRSDPEAALRWLLDEGLTHLELVPSFARHLADSLQRSAPQSRHSLRSLAFVGEPLQAPLLERFAQLLGPGCRLSNLYGPTEAVAVACRSGGPPWNGPGSVPVGPAVDGCQLWTAQPDGSPCPIGVKGEVVIRSRSLASGYWSPPSGPSPFAPDPWGRSRPARIYRSGDLGRLLPDGSLQLLGRLDHQVKVRGVRVELGEVESALAAHPAVAECAAAALPSPQGGLRLAAYLAPAQQQDRSLPGEYVRQCRQLYDGIYALRPQFSSADPGINLRAWTSAYTNRPLPEKTILDCVEDSARRIRSHAPRRVLEMGAGSGLLAFRLAPDCSSYRAADLSPQALDYLRSRLRRTPLPSLRLEQRQADDFSGIEEASLDAVVLNLVAMHFPDAPYLMRFLDSALLALRPGGLLFVGGLRHLALLPALQASVILQRAPGEASAASLRAELHERLRWEKDLLIDPRLFALYARSSPLAQGLRLLPKGTPGSDEISRYQYDALIYRRAEAQPPPAPRLPWREAPRGEQGLQRLQAELLRRRPSCLALRSLPNARLQQDLAARSLIDSSLHSAGRLRSLCRQASCERAFDPARLTRWAERLGYHAEASWARGAADGSFDLILCRRQDFPQPPLFDLCSQQDPQPWERYLNNPLRQAQASQLVPQLRRHLKALLPEPYVPSAFVILDQLPRSPNGKIDRKALPAPEETAYRRPGSFVPARTPMEKRLARIWRELLSLDQVGREDDFFDLGGHSLLATQLINRVREELGIDLPLRTLFRTSTIAGLASELEKATPQRQELGKIAQLMEQVQQLSPSQLEDVLQEREEQPPQGGSVGDPPA